VIVPLDRISPEVLAAVVEEYVTRDGTELTDAETKVAQVEAAVERGALVLVFDPESETCTFLPRDDVPTEDVDQPHVDPV
jgi:uncharacterized protein YheU (UPF0270 family)